MVSETPQQQASNPLKEILMLLMEKCIISLQNKTFVFQNKTFICVIINIKFLMCLRFRFRGSIDVG